MASGSAACRNSIPSHNASIVDRYLASGPLPFAKTTTLEFALLAVTAAMAYGPRRNPWDLQRSPGGSSGGSAAVIPPMKIGEQAPNPVELIALNITSRLGRRKLLLKSGLIDKMARD